MYDASESPLGSFGSDVASASDGWTIDDATSVIRDLGELRTGVENLVTPPRTQGTQDNTVMLVVGAVVLFWLVSGR